MKKNSLWVCFIFLLFFPGITVSFDKVILETGEWAPYCSKSIPKMGLFPELIEEVFKIAKIKYEIRFRPYKRCEIDIETGKAWATFPYGYTVKRAEKFNFSKHLDSIAMKLFYYGPNDDGYFVYNKYEDLKKYKIGNIMTFYYYDSLKSHLGDKAIHCIDDKDAFNKLITTGKRRRRRGVGVELVPTSYLVGKELLKNTFKDEYKNISVLEKNFEIPNVKNDSKMRLMVSKSYPNSDKILKAFNKALAEFKQGPKYKAIMKKYGK